MLSTGKFLRSISDAVKAEISRKIGRVIVTGCCKGGVGKSTVALNTAISLSRKNVKVGIFDADLSGPSIPIMAGTMDQRLYFDESNKFFPAEAFGIKMVSTGNCFPYDRPLMYKTAYISNVIEDLINKCKWELDYLIVDTPPGTGDIHIKLHQLLNIDASILVSSPHTMSTRDLRRSIDLYKRYNIPIMGVVKNFDKFTCDYCKEESQIYSSPGFEKMLKDAGIPLLGSLPIDQTVALGGDQGFPIVIRQPDSKIAKTFDKIASQIITKYPKKEK